jgi:hypothetical protein
MSVVEEPQGGYVRVVVAIPADPAGAGDMASSIPVGEWLRLEMGFFQPISFGALVLAVDVRRSEGEPEPEAPVHEDRLAEALRSLHAQGRWIEAWYPLADGRFECRLDDGSWAVDADPLAALAAAMKDARHGDTDD